MQNRDRVTLLPQPAQKQRRADRLQRLSRRADLFVLHTLILLQRVLREFIPQQDVAAFPQDVVGPRSQLHRSVVLRLSRRLSDRRERLLFRIVRDSEHVELLTGRRHEQAVPAQHRSIQH